MAATNRYTLKPRPPVEGFLASSILVAMGALGTAMAGIFGGHAWMMGLGLIPLVIGLVVLALVWRSMGRAQTVVETSDAGWAVHGPDVDGSGTWADVKRAGTAREGAELVLHHHDGSTTSILNRQGDDEQMRALVADVAKRLDADRGYGETMHVPLIDPHNPDPDKVS